MALPLRTPPEMGLLGAGGVPAVFVLAAFVFGRAARLRAALCRARARAPAELVCGDGAAVTITEVKSSASAAHAGRSLEEVFMVCPSVGV
jgi:hypothetical protein